MPRLFPLVAFVALLTVATAVRAQGELSPREFVVFPSASFSLSSGDEGLSDAASIYSGGVDAALGRVGLHVGFGHGTRPSQSDVTLVAVAAGYYLAREGRPASERLTLEAGLAYASGEGQTLGPFLAASSRVVEGRYIVVAPQGTVQYLIPVGESGPFGAAPRQLAISAGLAVGFGEGDVRPVIAPAVVLVPGAREGDLGFTLSVGLAIGVGR